MDQIGSGVPLDTHGAAQHRIYDLLPGESVEVDAQSINHPIIQKIMESGDFELLNVSLAPGGEVEADPAEPTGATKKLELNLTNTLLTDAATDQSFGMGALPSGAVVLDAYAEITDVFDGGGSSSSGVELGSAADPDAIAGTLNLFGATGLVGATLLAKSFPLGIDVFAKVSSDVNVSLLTAASAKITLLYVVL